MSHSRAIERVRPVVDARFSRLKEQVQALLPTGYNIGEKKRLMKEYAPEEVVGTGKVLLDTLINFLMEDALVRLDRAPTTLKREFLDADFRSRIERAILLDPQTLVFRYDPRALYGATAGGGVIAVAGTISVMVYFAGGTVIAILVAVGALVAAAFAFKAAYDKGDPKSRRQFEDDIWKYVDSSIPELMKCLEEVAKQFDADLLRFCRDNGFALEA